jgi:hypothetical protein
MKLSATAVATVVLFASGISAKKDRSLGCCKSAEEGQQMCSTYIHPPFSFLFPLLKHASPAEEAKAFGRIEHGIAECQSGKWMPLLECPKSYACKSCSINSFFVHKTWQTDSVCVGGKDPIPHCFAPTATSQIASATPTKSVQQSWNLTIHGLGNQTLQNSGNHTIFKPGNLTITLKPEPSKGVAGRIVV